MSATDQIHLALRNRHADEKWAYFDELRTKTGHTGRCGYVDAFAVGLWNDNRGCIAYEIKQSKSDFKSDIASFAVKQAAALRNSTQFYYVCPQGLISIDEVPEVSGLMWLDAGGIKTKKVAPLRTLQDGCLDLDFTMALLRAAAEKPVKSILWKYAGQEVNEAQMLKISQDLGHAYSEDRIKHDAKTIAAMKRQRSWAILKKFCEATGMWPDLDSGTIEGKANQLVAEYHARRKEKDLAVNISRNAQQIMAIANQLNELIEKQEDANAGT